MINNRIKPDMNLYYEDSIPTEIYALLKKMGPLSSTIV